MFRLIQPSSLMKAGYAETLVFHIFGDGTEWTIYLLFSFLFPELDALFFSPAPHLLWVQGFVLVAVHPVVIFGRTG